MNVWFLAYTPAALGHGLNPFFTTALNHPYGVDLLQNTSVELLGLLAWPVTALAGPVAADTVVGAAALALSAGAGYLLLTRFVAWRPAAFVGGLLYGFSPYQIGQAWIGHLNLCFVALPPLMALVLYDLAVRRRGRPARRGLLLGLLAVAQFFVSVEVLATTVLMLAVALAAGAVVGRRHWAARWRPTGIALGTAAAVAAVALALPLWYFLAGPAHVSGPLQYLPQDNRADLLGLVVPDQLQHLTVHAALARSDAFAGSLGENGSYLGLPLVVVLVAGVATLRRTPAVAVAAVVGGLAWVLSLGAALVVRANPAALPGVVRGLPLPERLLWRLPLLGSLSPVRLSLFVDLSAAVVLAVVLGRLRARTAAGWPAGRWPGPAAGGAAVAAALAVVALLPLVPAAPFPRAGPRATPVAALDRVPSGSVALLYPYPSDVDSRAEAWQAVAGVRFAMPGGYALVRAIAPHRLPVPNDVELTRPTLVARTLMGLEAGVDPGRSPALRQALRSELAAEGVTSVVAQPAGTPDPARAVAFLSWLVGRAPVPVDGAFAWYRVRF
jgi:hypothetical protein